MFFLPIQANVFLYFSKLTPFHNSTTPARTPVPSSPPLPFPMSVSCLRSSCLFTLFLSVYVSLCYSGCTSLQCFPFCVSFSISAPVLLSLPVSYMTLPNFPSPTTVLETQDNSRKITFTCFSKKKNNQPHWAHIPKRCVFDSRGRAGVYELQFSTVYTSASQTLICI